MIKLVIFDLDGTLLNTLDDLACSANAALSTCGFPPRSRQEVQRFVGNGVAKLLERALPSGTQTPENLTRLKQAFFDYYDAHLWTHTTPYPGIENLLTGLAARKILLAVASNKYQSATERLVRHFFPQLPFVAVSGQRENVPTKPNPQIVADILQTACVLPSETLYVGDSGVDMQTAQNAGVQACGVAWGFRPREELAAFAPCLLADTPKDLSDFLELNIF